jgi:hypothetical protein
VVTALSLAVGVGAVGPVAASAADRTAKGRPGAGGVPACEAAVAAPHSKNTAIGGAPAAQSPVIASIRTAQAGLATALTYFKNHQYPQAIMALAALRMQLAKAHQAGMSPMRPAGVIPVLNLEHMVAMRLLPPFNGLTRSSVVNALQTTLSSTFANRIAMLNAVIALPCQGVGGDYDDGMADTLGIYAAEVKAYTAAPGQFRLTAQSSTALSGDLTQVRATRTQVDRRFGGGE